MGDLKEWSAEDIRRYPLMAFDLFDANQNGYLSVSELLFTTRKVNPAHQKKGSLFAEMKLFGQFDLNGDAKISKEEFCSVVQSMSTEALQTIAGLASERERDKEALASPKSEPRPHFECVQIEIHAIGVPATVLDWWDFLGQPRAETYVATVTMAPERVVLARTELARGSLASWYQYRVERVDVPLGKVHFDLYGSDSRRIGSTAPVELPEDEEKTFGPLVFYDRLGRPSPAKLFGTLTPVNAEEASSLRDDLASTNSYLFWLCCPPIAEQQQQQQQLK